MTANPFSTPMSDVEFATARNTVSATAVEAVAPAIVDIMRQTKPWVMFLGVLGFISSGFMLLAGLFALVAGSFAGAGLPAWFALIYFAVAVLYVFPSMVLYRYARDIKSLLMGGGQASLISALGQQKTFWRYVGIMMLVILAIYALALVGGLGAALLLGGLFQGG